MDIRRVVVLGLLIGLLLNAVGIVGNGLLLRKAWSQALPVRPSGSITGGFGLLLSLLSDFVFGPVLVWLYAAISPRFGAGFSVAFRASILIWLLAVVVPYIGIVRIGWLPVGIVVMTSLLALVGFIPAAWLTAHFYREDPPT